MHVLHQHSVASDLTDHMTSIYLQILAVSLFCQFSAIVHSESTHVLCLAIFSRQIKDLICQLIKYPVLTLYHRAKFRLVKMITLDVWTWRMRAFQLLEISENLNYMKLLVSNIIM